MSLFVYRRKFVTFVSIDQEIHNKYVLVYEMTYPYSFVIPKQ